MIPPGSLNYFYGANYGEKIQFLVNKNVKYLKHKKVFNVTFLILLL